MLTPGKNYVGTEIRITLTITDDACVATDPTTLKVKTHAPNGVVTTYTYGTDAALQRQTTGIYIFDVTPNAPGRWDYRLETTGTGTVITKEAHFYVQDSPFYNAGSTAYQG